MRKLFFYIAAILISLVLEAQGSPVYALSREDIVRTAYRDMLDREPSSEELKARLRQAVNYDIIKKELNQIPERIAAIQAIYQRSLKRNPRFDELTALIQFAAPNNRIRKALFESLERRLAIADAYQGFINRAPQQHELDFYVVTRSPFDKIKIFLNSKDERVEAMNLIFLRRWGRFPAALEKKYVLDNLLYLSLIGASSLKPVAVAMNQEVLGDAAEVTLDASQSFDLSDSRIMAYEWEVVESPVVLTPVFFVSSTPISAFSLPQSNGRTVGGIYKLRLQVRNTRDVSDPVIVEFLVNNYSKFEQHLLDLTNALRAVEGESGAVPLKFNAKLNAAAQKYSQYMLSNMWFSHDAKDGTGPDKRALDEGYDFEYVGENLGVIKTNNPDFALDFAAVDSLFKSWKESPDHYSNIISNKFVEIGIGFAIGDTSDTQTPKQLYSAVNFGKTF